MFDLHTTDRINPVLLKELRQTANRPATLIGLLLAITALEALLCYLRSAPDGSPSLRAHQEVVVVWQYIATGLALFVPAVLVANRWQREQSDPDRDLAAGLPLTPVRILAGKAAAMLLCGGLAMLPTLPLWGLLACDGVVSGYFCAAFAACSVTALALLLLPPALPLAMIAKVMLLIVAVASVAAAANYEETPSLQPLFLLWAAVLSSTSLCLSAGLLRPAIHDRAFPGRVAAWIGGLLLMAGTLVQPASALYPALLALVVLAAALFERERPTLRQWRLVDAWPRPLRPLRMLLGSGATNGLLQGGVLLGLWLCLSLFSRTECSKPTFFPMVFGLYFFTALMLRRRLRISPERSLALVLLAMNLPAVLTTVSSNFLLFTPAAMESELPPETLYGIYGALFLLMLVLQLPELAAAFRRPRPASPDA